MAPLYKGSCPASSRTDGLLLGSPVEGELSARRLTEGLFLGSPV